MRKSKKKALNETRCVCVYMHIDAYILPRTNSADWDNIHIPMTINI